MIARRTLLAAPALAGQAPPARMHLCIHQTTSAAAGFRKSLEGYAKAGIRSVEVIPQHVDEFVRSDGMAAARRLLADLGMKSVAGGGVRGFIEPGPRNGEALEQLKTRAAVWAELGVDRMVCPCGTADKYTVEDYKRGVENLQKAGEIVKPFGVTAMLEFMRGSTFIGTLVTALDMTRRAAHPFVKPMFDFYHFQAGLSRMEDLDLIRPGELHHVHFQDVPGIPRELLDNGTREVPGEGVGPLVKILQALDGKGYRGPLSVELFYPHVQKTDPYEMAARIRRQAEPIMKRAGVA